MMRCSVCGSRAVELDPTKMGRNRCGYCGAVDSQRHEPAEGPLFQGGVHPNEAELEAYSKVRADALLNPSKFLPDIDVDYG